MIVTAAAGPARAEDPAPQRVAAELCLAVDGSGSIHQDEFAFQRRAYADAIASREVIDGVTSGYSGAIAVAMMEWGGADSMHPIVGWTRIAGLEDARRFGAAIVAAPRKAVGWNSISNAIAFCQNWIETNAFQGLKKVIDVSGDAGQHGGVPLDFARLNATDAGITINGLALNYRSGGMTGPGGTPLVEHFRNDVIGGPGAFAIGVDSEAEFITALRRKLVLELAQR